MLKRFLMFGLALGVTTSLANADVIFQWNGSDEKVELEAGVNTKIEVSMATNPGLDAGIGLIVLGFSASDPAIQLKSWEWVPQLSDDLFYLAIGDLPDGIQTAYSQFTCAPPLTFCLRIPDGEKTVIANLTIQVDEPGTYDLDASTDAEFAEADIGTMEIKSGLQVKLNVVPEPACLGMLLLGSLVMIRRR